MTRFILFICLISQVMAANAAFAATRCAHADMEQMTHAMHGMNENTQAIQASEETSELNCECPCEIVGHCEATMASAVVDLNLGFGSFPPIDLARVTLPSGISNAHKSRLDRPPSSI